MSISLSIDTVTTEDAVPTTAPFKVSNVATYTQWQVKFTPTTSDSSPIRSLRVIFNSSSRAWPTGKLIYNLGAVCGLDRCGAPNVMPLSCTQGVQKTVTKNYSDLPSTADGAYSVYVWAASDTQGWN